MSDLMAATGVTHTGEPTQIENKSSNLGKDDFLKLLITQMRYQDPLEPMDNKEFIAQTAQFTSLEQMTNMNENMNKFLEMQQLSQVSGLVDKEVTVLDSGSGERVTGTIERINISDGNVAVFVNGNPYNMGSILEIIGESGNIEEGIEFPEEGDLDE